MGAEKSLACLIIQILLSYFHITHQSSVKLDHDLPDIGDDQCGDTTSGSKRSFDSLSGPDATMNKYRKTNYSSKSSPFETNLTPSKIAFLKSKEEELSKAGSRYDWDFKNLKYDRAKHLCIESFQLEPIELIIEPGMSPDCDVMLTRGTSYTHPGAKKYYGRFIYYKPKEGESIDYEGDLLKCNCAYTNFNFTGKLKTVWHSKRYFFLLKRSETLYYVLTILNICPYSRFVRVINTYELSKAPPKPEENVVQDNL